MKMDLWKRMLRILRVAPDILLLPAHALLAATCITAGAQSTRTATPAGGVLSDNARGQAWWAHIRVLADDSMKGRLTGSDEYLKSAAYVVDKLRSWGLQPAGVNGTYYQPVHFDVLRVLAQKSALALEYDGANIPLQLGDDAILGTRMQQPAGVDAPLVFIGYGLHLPETGYNDFDSPEVPAASLKGKIVVVVNGGPADLPGPLKSFARTSPLIKAIREAGAIGLVSIPTPKSMDFGWRRVASSASQPGMRLGARARGQRGSRPASGPGGRSRTVVYRHLQPGPAEKLFQGSGHRFADILALADAQKPLLRFPLGKSIHATIATENSQVISPNIAAVLPGSDASLKQQYVVISAHLDHLGVGEPIHGKTIYPGAMDDASGVASVLETARTLGQGKHPKRSLLVLIFTAEEKGLLGSRYFAGNPTVPEGSIVADLNLDMFMPIFALKKLHVQGLEQSTLADQARSVGAAHHIEIAGDPEPDRNSFIRTDQYSFVQAGVPALAMKFGWASGSPEYKAWRAWLAERYHSTDDDLTQPFDLAAAAQFNDFFADLAGAVANESTTPHYLVTSFFKRFETHP